MSVENTAPIKWAQRTDSLYLTISLADVKNESITLTDDKLVFTGTSNNKEYSVDIEFFKKCDGEKSTYNVLPRSIQMYIVKSEAEDDFWPRLLKDKSKEKNQIAIDWDKYVDEDEEEDAGGFDQSSMEGGQSMGGPGGPGGPGGMGGMGGGPGGGMPAGMDMEALMKQMGGAGGAGGMDMQKMMASMGNMGGAGGADVGNMDDLNNDQMGEEDDSDDDECPDLEEA